MAHDVLNAHDLLPDELAQRRESGFDVAQLAKEAAAADPANTAQLFVLLDGLADAERTGDWPYDEPEGLAAITAALGPAEAVGPPTADDLEDKIEGGWLGRIAGCNLGKPVEYGDHWTSDHIRDYLESRRRLPAA